jgi:hypothetical protein
MQRELLTGLLCLVSFTGACSSKDGSEQFVAARTMANRPPAISGSPMRSIVVGEFYDFMPKASDAEGHTLSFTIVRKPRWTAFNPRTGRLYGTPGTGDVGIYSNVAITVSDSRSTTTLSPFDIAVNQQGNRSVTLSWMPPMEKTDGSVLTDLMGYRIYYGRSASTLNQSVVINNPGLTRYVVEGLSTARWYFAMTAVDRSGNESKRSSTVSKTIG